MTLIYNEINSIAALLKPADIEPIFIKGSAALLMGLYEKPGLRIMSDVDFLVSKKDMSTCTELMQSVGYYPMEGLWLPEDCYHGFPLVHDSHSIRFEIHDRLADKPILESDAIIADSVQIQMESGVVRIPSKEHFTMNNILHHQVFDRGIENENLLLYQLLDLYTMRQKFDSQLNWKSIGAFFTSHSHQNAFCFSIDMLRKYFNQRLPKKMPASLQFHIHYRQSKNRYNKLIHRLKQ